MNLSGSVADVKESVPGYHTLYEKGLLHVRVEAVRERLLSCDLCPRKCGVNRLEGERGYCRSGARAIVASVNPHHGEEPCLSGTRGSGTIFFSNCTAHCIFCQNYPISQLGLGSERSTAELAEAMLSLQRRGCHNINLVTPTHFLPQILSALEKAVGGGLRIPLVYNTSGYERVSVLKLLDGIIDIYLPDAKYADEDVAHELSGFDDYVECNRRALVEMQRQVGEELILDEKGIAQRGLIIRHLVLPHGLSQTEQVLSWIAENLSKRTYISLMAQYFPAYKAVDHPKLGRRLLPHEYAAALEAFDAAGLENGWRQGVDSIY
ncbi:MAG: radical SAM protein [Chloroflexota bacterium]|nr:radical SAM protein [Chloroflexota bacterium]